MVLIGSDVEYFVQDSKGAVVSAEGLIPGFKTAPARFDPDEPWFATQLDNVLAEGNIPPAATADQFVSNMERLYKHMDNLVFTQIGGGLVAKAAHLFHPTQLVTEWSKTFGCDPSYNCWTGELEEVTPLNPMLRSAGFHIHIGYESPSMETNRAIARAMDLYLGVPSVLLDDQGDLRRKGGYGSAGNFRHQKHGVEYRTLSSYLASSPRLLAWAFENARTAYAVATNDGFIERNPVLRTGSVIQTTINTSDRAAARSLVRQYEIPMP
jgi:hypothetical protein